MGHIFQTQFRLDPIVGVGETIVLATALVQPNPESVDVAYPAEMDERRDVNREEDPRILGTRPVVTLSFWNIDTNSPDHDVIVKIENALKDPHTDVYLSLDGGTVERKVVLRPPGVVGPLPLAGKSVAGSQFRMTVAAKEIIPERVGIGSGNW